jgi:RimJ/RimL family protein N-acetyltransferase
MLRGEKVGLRARHESDVQILDDELQSDVMESLRSQDAPWVPISPGSSSSPFGIKDPVDRVASFSVVELASDTLAGVCNLWNIDLHNRRAHIGVGLRPAFRGRGLGTDIVAVLCYYGFVIRGLNRIQLETLDDNHAMIRVAQRAGFTQEAVLRSALYIAGQFRDEITFGLLASEWKPAPA